MPEQVGHHSIARKSAANPMAQRRNLRPGLRQLTLINRQKDGVQLRFNNVWPNELLSH